MVQLQTAGQEIGYGANFNQPTPSLFDILWDIVQVPTVVVKTELDKQFDVGLLPYIVDVEKEKTPKNGNGGNGKPNRFLPYLLGGMLAVAAAPTLYRAATASSRGKRGARHGEIASSLESSSNRAVSLLGAFAPVVALPATYIAVDELENRGIISGPLGDDVQTLLGAMAGGQLLTGLLNLATKAAGL